MMQHMHPRAPRLCATRLQFVSWRGGIWQQHSDSLELGDGLLLMQRTRLEQEGRSPVLIVTCAPFARCAKLGRRAWDAPGEVTQAAALDARQILAAELGGGSGECQLPVGSPGQVGTSK